ncbi:MAG: TRAFAC clade GTPase domain-containing protein [Terriglobales bacterium]
MSAPPSRWPPAPEPSKAEQIVDQTAIPKMDDLTADLSKVEKMPEFVELPNGKELNEEAALNLAKSRPVQWIVLAGPVDSGKTTFLTSLYELFQWRQVEGFAFAGSNTLPAFEERCYLSRRDSGNPVPHTQRTPYKGPDPEYLHLRIRSIGGLRQFRDFLFTDVSGEMFEHARDSTAECKEMIFLKRANHFLLFLDSAKGMQQDKRWAMVEDNKALLQSCVDSEMIGPTCSVNVIWSRFDHFVAKNTEDQHRGFRADVEREFRETFGHRIPKLLFSEVAARPLQAPDLLIGHGVSNLLKQWAETPLEMKALKLFPSSYSGTRESEIFATRHFSSTRANEESHA